MNSTALSTAILSAILAAIAQVCDRLAAVPPLTANSCSRLETIFYPHLQDCREENQEPDLKG